MVYVLTAHSDALFDSRAKTVMKKMRRKTVDCCIFPELIFNLDPTIGKLNSIAFIWYITLMHLSSFTTLYKGKCKLGAVSNYLWQSWKTAFECHFGPVAAILSKFFALFLSMLTLRKGKKAQFLRKRKILIFLVQASQPNTDHSASARYSCAVNNC